MTFEMCLYSETGLVESKKLNGQVAYAKEIGRITTPGGLTGDIIRIEIYADGLPHFNLHRYGSGWEYSSPGHR